jgi:hypothetical protein
MWKKTLLALAAISLLGASFSTEAQAAPPRRPLLRAIVEANRNAALNQSFQAPVPTWGYRYQPPGYGWSFRPDTGWGFYQSGGTWGWGFGY